MTDTQRKDMIGAYGLPQMATPNLDHLAASGVRFDRAYTACPLCTPARGALFSGIHPQLNGATYNGVCMYRHIPNAGELFRRAGYRTAYTGKWHLDGDYPYLGSGEPDPGFEPDWWYDGQCYRNDVGEDTYSMCYKGGVLSRVDSMPDDPACYWAHRVADRALDFLGQTGDEPFFLVASFDEPHGPYCAPPSYYRDIDPDDFPVNPTFNVLGTGKPEMQQISAAHNGICPEEDLRRYYRQYYACNRFVDAEIGRVLDAVPDNTIVVYTSDHGGCMADYRLWTKAFWMYDVATNIPLIISGPGIAEGVSTQAIASHVDVLPTLLARCGVSGLDPIYSEGRIVLDGTQEHIREQNLWIDRMHGVDLSPVLSDPSARVRDWALISYLRFGNLPKKNRWGGYYPVRCAVNDRHKLVLNLDDTDEFYDLEEDPHELENRLYENRYTDARNSMHDELLDYMDEITDPLRSYRWGNRSWRAVRTRHFHQPLQ